MKKISKILLANLLTIGLIFTACDNGGGSSTTSGTTDTNKTTKPTIEPSIGTTITVVDGYIKDANVTDSLGQIAIYKSKGRYTFTNSPLYPITAIGGVYEDTNQSFDLNMTAQEPSLVISPITSFLENNSTLLDRFANLNLGVTTLDEFQIDYIESNNTSLSKLSQILYIVQKNKKLSKVFKSSLISEEPTNLDDMFTIIETDIDETTVGKGYVKSYKRFLSKIKSLDENISTYETQLEQGKLNLNSIIKHNGTIYETVTSPFTGKIWLDRNLGASQVCTAYNDSACYGDYYQWGRGFDGHQSRNSETNTTAANDINNAGKYFIKSLSDWVEAGVDDNGSLRIANWSKTDGSSVCPVGYRVPTVVELSAETIEASTKVNNIYDAFDNFLKISADGTREKGNGSLWYANRKGWYWTSASEVYSIEFNITGANTVAYLRPYGFSVRCIKD